jgi:hypothetical protein
MAYRSFRSGAGCFLAPALTVIMAQIPHQYIGGRVEPRMGK